MLPSNVLSRSTANHALLAVLALFSSRVCTAVGGSGYSGDSRLGQDFGRSLYTSNTPVDRALGGSGYDSDTRAAPDLDESVSSQTRETPSSTMDIGRLLFKQMRFRDVSDAARQRLRASFPVLRLWLGYRPWRTRASVSASRSSRRDLNTVLKRENDKMIVDNLAALISNMKGRDTNSQMRMPSLRFG